MQSFRDFFRPHVTIPQVPWRAQHRWDLNITRVSILCLGLAIFGIGDAMLVESMIGNAPWTVLAQGLSGILKINLGTMTAIISMFVLLLWIPLRERPGFGTLLNIIVIATFIQIGVDSIPAANQLYEGVLYAFMGVAMVGLGSALYISVGLGPGPRDGAMTGFHRLTGLPIGRVRLAIELVVLTLGGLCGGKIGLGTAIFALFIGQSIAIQCGVLARLTRST